MPRASSIAELTMKYLWFRGWQ